jgi:hypothetical protein
MKHLAIATFILGIFVTAANAQAYKAVTFNGMVFDTPPAQGWDGASSQEAERPQELGVINAVR